MLVRNLKTCLTCPDRPRGCHGACLCAGVDIIDRAKSGDCPRGRFRWRGAGDALAWVLGGTGIAAAWKWLRRGKPCGCAKRQAALNKALPLRVE